jgi:protein-disulfide isomerase
MLEPPRNAPELRRSRAWLWAVVPIALGLVVLVGGALAGLVFAVRRAESSASGTAARPGVAVPSLAPTSAPPRLASPSFETPAAQPDGEAEPSLLPSLPSSPAGLRARPSEANALLPVASGATIWGAADAPVTLALFGDLGCPHTRLALRRVLRSALAAPGRLRLVFHHRPLDERVFSIQAARVLAGVARQAGSDAAWRVLTEAARSTSPPGLEELERWLSIAGIEAPHSALAGDPAALARLREDAELAVLLDVQSTPTLFVNGRRLIGAPPEALLARAVEDEARAVRWLRAQGVSSEQAYARRARRNLIGVEDGAANRACVPADKAPVDGAADALVTLVEFSDFECTHCRALEPALSAVLARYPGQVRRVWRSFALPQHPHARRAAAFALAARELGGERAFWAVHAALLAASADALGDASLRSLASRLGLDGPRLLAASDDPRRASELEQDHELARNLDIEGAPTLFVNGRRISGAVSAAVLDGVVREELDAARRVVRRGTRASSFEALFCGG